MREGFLMAKPDRVRVSEHLGNDWAVRRHSARRAVEAAQVQQVAMERSPSTSAYQSQQMATMIAQNNALIALGERTNELLSYLADRAFDESQAREGEVEGVDEASGL